MTPIVEKHDVPADARLPTVHGEFRIRVFHDQSTGFDHVALTLGCLLYTSDAADE